jgi:hypothetical protein
MNSSEPELFQNQSDAHFVALAKREGATILEHSQRQDPVTGEWRHDVLLYTDWEYRDRLDHMTDAVISGKVAVLPTANRKHDEKPPENAA